MELNAFAKCFEGAFGLSGFVDDVVVEYDVDGLGATVGVGEDV